MLSGACPLLMPSRSACPLWTFVDAQSACPLWTLSFVGAVDDLAECLSFVDVPFVDAGAAMALPLDDDQVELMARALKNITAPTMQSGRLA
jgi:hypothetical protein